MKKIVLTLGIALGLSTTPFAADPVVEQVNEEVVNILAPLQNPTTSAKLNFGVVETDADRVINVALSAYYRKLGSNALEVKVDDLSYHYGDGTAPITQIKFTVNFNFTKLFDRDWINKAMANAASELERLVNFTEGYEDAASVIVVITSINTDANGNYTGLTALLSAKIDLNKLPEGIPSSDVMETEVTASISLDVSTGFSFEAFLIMNPSYRGFEHYQLGLKEGFDKLLSRDDEYIEEIKIEAMNADNNASKLVEYVINTQGSDQNFILINNKISYKYPLFPLLKANF